LKATNNKGQNTMLNTTHTFDGTIYTISESPVHGLCVTVTDTFTNLELVTRDGLSLAADAITNTEAMKKAGHDAWLCDRIAYVFHLAARRIIQG
jgi:hypothetical protein